MHIRKTAQTLNRLIRACRDAERLCMNCASLTGTAELAALISQRSEEWARQGDELQALVLLLDGTPENSGSFSGYWFGLWATFRAQLVGRSDLTAVEEWQRAQERSLDRYEEALAGYLPERIRRTVDLQADRIIERLEQISALCGQYSIETDSVSTL